MSNDNDGKTGENGDVDDHHRSRKTDDERLEDYYTRLSQFEDPTLPLPLLWTHHLRVLLCGVHDKESPLSLLQGYEDSVLRRIHEMVLESWKASVNPVPPSSKLIEVYGRPAAEFGDCDVAFSSVGTFVSFPEPNNRHVNMMPFVMGDRSSLPDDLQVYYDQLVCKCPVGDSDYDQVCYLTVHESYVEAGQTQRRGGLHVEAEGGVVVPPGKMAQWGGGLDDEFAGGIFLASNVAGTTQVYEDVVDHSYWTVDRYGDIEHLRPFLGEGIKLEAGELIWLTDRTPHEALPQVTSGYRQFFRLVTSNLSHWFEEHSTPNPKVPVPDHVDVIRGSKF